MTTGPAFPFNVYSKISYHKPFGFVDVCLFLMIFLLGCERQQPPQKKAQAASEAKPELVEQATKLRILFRSPIPSAVNSPYTDCLFSVKAETLSAGKSIPKGQQIIVFLRAFSQRKYAPEAFLSVGDRASVHLIPFEQKKEVQQWQRSDATEELDLPVYWCEQMEPPYPIEDHGKLMLGSAVTAQSTGPPTFPREQMEHMLVDMNRQMNSKGIHFAVSIPPFKEELSPSYPPNPGYTEALAHERKQLVKTLGERQIHVISLDTSLNDPTLASTAYYPNKDNHLTASGLDAAAGSIADFLRQKGWVDDSQKMAFTDKLISMGETTFSARQVFDDKGPLNTEPKGTSIRLIGDSLLRYPDGSPYQASVPGANLAAQLSRELGQRVGNFSVSSGAAIMPRLLKFYPEVIQGTTVCIFVISTYYAFTENTTLWKPVAF